MPNLAGRRPSDVDNPAHKPLTLVDNHRPRAFRIEAWCAPNSHFLAGAAALDETWLVKGCFEQPPGGSFSLHSGAPCPSSGRLAPAKEQETAGTSLSWARPGAGERRAGGAC